jgi:ankyrin repeat protein
MKPIWGHSAIEPASIVRLIGATPAADGPCPEGDGMRRTKILAGTLLVGFLLPLQSHALDCPKMPEQAHKDWEIEVKLAVGKIGPAKGAELETLARSATKDLMGKLPQADRVYLEQMMYATYCSALRDDSTLSESEKGIRVRAYNLEVRKTLYGPQGKDDRGHPASPAQGQRDAARAELARIPLEYTPKAFVESAESGDVRAVRLYLAAGMDPNAADNKSNTALMRAARKGHTEIIEALLKAKANVNARNSGGGTALDWAAAAGQKEALRTLLGHGADTQSVNEAFVTAAGSGELPIMRALVDKGADIRAIGARALGHAAYASGDHEDTVRFLLDRGVDANASDDEGWTALHTAASKGHPSVARALLEKGANSNAKCACEGYMGGGQTALILAALSKHVDVVELLLVKAANISLTNNRGATALMAGVGSKALIRVLLDHGADVNAQDNDGRTALMRAYTHADELQTLLDRGADVNAKAKNGETVLMMASYHSLESVRTLVNKGADVNAKDKDGTTALMRAARNGEFDIVRVLLKHGARVNEEDEIGKTALDHAEGKLEGEMKGDMVRLLKKAGAK